MADDNTSQQGPELSVYHVLGSIRSSLLDLEVYCKQHPSNVDKHFVMSILSDIASLTGWLPEMRKPQAEANGKDARAN